ncbi:hypothetical protein HAX54_012048, partial [Datura stramonium]|nr:hypothetical protein [Datura stramonium]
DSSAIRDSVWHFADGSLIWHSLLMYSGMHRTRWFAYLDRRFVSPVRCLYFF